MTVGIRPTRFAAGILTLGGEMKKETSSVMPHTEQLASMVGKLTTEIRLQKVEPIIPETYALYTGKRIERRATTNDL